jgi:DUF1365 family protein
MTGYVGEAVLKTHLRTAVAWTCAVLGGIWHVSRTICRKKTMPGINHKQPDTAFLKPCMIPCRTTHSRLFPTKHYFSYSYLYAGIPVGWQGAAGTLLSAERGTRKTWFSVVAEDYLEKNTHQDGLAGKLRDYLLSQSVSPEQFPYAYLVTAPRFLGFSFNPVSFWYLYDSNRSLAAMILEVNNTFDERRMYFMERKADSNELENLDVKFAQEWPKDFHVSPFNDRGGTYSIQSTDPFHVSIEGMHRVDNNIVLKSEDGKPKVVARVFSTEPPTDTTSMSSWQTATFVLRWWWVGFMTNPRILKEARTLWLKKLQLYYRPEVKSSSIGRSETPDEARLESFFRAYLQWTADKKGILVRYIPAAGPSRAKPLSICAQNLDNVSKPESEVEIRVLTPAFYGQLVRYSTLREGFDQTCLQARDGEAMVQCTQPEVLQQELTQVLALPQDSTQPTTEWVLLDSLRHHSLLAALWNSLLATLTLSGRHTNLSEFDRCVRSGSSQAQARLYYRVALKLLLADRIAFGWMPVLRLEEIIVRSLLVLAAASAIGDFLEAESLSGRRTFSILFQVCGLHIWSILV